MKVEFTFIPGDRVIYRLGGNEREMLVVPDAESQVGTLHQRHANNGNPQAEVELVARPVYVTPEREQALSACFEALMTANDLKTAAIVSKMISEIRHGE